MEPFGFFCFLILVDFSSAHDPSLITVSLPAVAGVVLVSGQGGQYKFNFSEAMEVCRSRNLTLVTTAQLQRALDHGLETCRFGWVLEEIAAVPRRHSVLKCGSGKTGVVTWNTPKNQKFGAWCFNASDFQASTTPPPTISTTKVQTTPQTTITMTILTTTTTRTTTTMSAPDIRTTTTPRTAKVTDPTTQPLTTRRAILDVSSTLASWIRFTATPKMNAATTTVSTTTTTGLIRSSSTSTSNPFGEAISSVSVNLPKQRDLTEASTNPPAISTYVQTTPQTTFTTTVLTAITTTTSTSAPDIRTTTPLTTRRTGFTGLIDSSSTFGSTSTSNPFGEVITSASIKPPKQQDLTEDSTNPPTISTTYVQTTPQTTFTTTVLTAITTTKSTSAPDIRTTTILPKLSKVTNPTTKLLTTRRTVLDVSSTLASWIRSTLTPKTTAAMKTVSPQFSTTTRSFTGLIDSSSTFVTTSTSNPFGEAISSVSVKPPKQQVLSRVLIIFSVVAAMLTAGAALYYYRLSRRKRIVAETEMWNMQEDEEDKEEEEKRFTISSEPIME